MRFTPVLSLSILVALAATRPVWAHSAGIAAQGCDGCHSGGQAPAVTLTANATDPSVGQEVTLTVTVSQTNGPVAGFFLTTRPSVGTFTAIQAGTVAASGGVMHTMPRTGSKGFTTFQATWSTSQASGVQFYAYGLSANGDGSSRGDAGGAASLSMTVGCAGTTYYIDQDGDGYGTSDPAYPVIRECAPPLGYAAVAGDCDDFDPTVHPGATEVCNSKDDNCNGQIDEGLTPQFYCRDLDGDGHGVHGEGEEASCRPMTGYGDCGGDCNDSDPTVYLQVTCGVGWCKRNALGCSSTCTPGPPRTEVCNAFDDDCDGVIDNGTDLQLCGATGLKCVEGVCVSGSSVGGAGGSQTPGAGGSHDAGAGAGPGGSGGGSPTRSDAGSGSGGRASGGSTGAGAPQGGCAIEPLSPEHSPLGGGVLALGAALALRSRARPRHRRARNSAEHPRP
jgi:hypothetical protein